MCMGLSAMRNLLFWFTTHMAERLGQLFPDAKEREAERPRYEDRITEVIDYDFLRREIYQRDVDPLAVSEEAAWEWAARHRQVRRRASGGPTVAIAIAGDAQIHGRQELRITGRSGPAPLELRPGIAAIHELGGRDELCGEELPPPYLICERCQRIQQIEIARERTVIRLVTINGHHDLFGNARLGLDALKQRPQRQIARPAPLDPRGIDMAGAVRCEAWDGRPRRAAGLGAIQFDHPREKCQVGDDLVERRG